METKKRTTISWKERKKERKNKIKMMINDDDDI